MSSSPFAAWMAAACLAMTGCARQETLERSTAMLSAPRSTPLLAAGAVDRTDRHLLVTLRLTDAALEVIDAREVAMPLPLDRAPGVEPWRVLVEDAAGAVLYVAQLPAAEVAGAEVASPDGTLQRVRTPPRDAVFALRTPLLRGAAALTLYAHSSSLRPEHPHRAEASAEGMVELGKAALPAVKR